MANQTHDALIRKLVANARAIISDQVGLSVGALKMLKILRWLEVYERPHIRGIDVFEKYEERTRLIPSGTARLHCSDEAFKRYDKALQEVNTRLRAKILEVCFQIIDKYSSRTKL